MEKLLKQLSKKPELYTQTKNNMWADEYISQGMLKAHLNERLDSATRRIDVVKKSVDWISTILPSSQYPKLLDLGCGPGIYTELFYTKGYQVTGVDISKRSIQYAQISANQKQMKIQYILDDYTQMTIAQRYHLITLIYCDFGVLPTETRRQLLEQMYNLLLPQGIIIFDVFKPLKYHGMKESKSWKVCEKGFFHGKLSLILQSFYRYDHDQTFLNQYTVVTKDQEIFTYNVWEHTFSFVELENVLKEVGFTNIQFYGDIMGSQCQETDETICVVAQKSVKTD